MKGKSPKEIGNYKRHEVQEDTVLKTWKWICLERWTMFRSALPVFGFAQTNEPRKLKYRKCRFSQRLWALEKKKKRNNHIQFNPESKFLFLSFLGRFI